MSGAPRDVGSVNYYPGPGRYSNFDGQTSFNMTYVRDIREKDQYYVLKHGILQRKLQLYSIDKSKRLVPTLSQSPGPGTYEADPRPAIQNSKPRRTKCEDPY